MKTSEILKEAEFRARSLVDLCNDAEAYDLDPDVYVDLVANQNVMFGNHKAWEELMILIRNRIDADRHEAIAKEGM